MIMLVFVEQTSVGCVDVSAVSTVSIRTCERLNPRCDRVLSLLLVHETMPLGFTLLRHFNSSLDISSRPQAPLSKANCETLLPSNKGIIKISVSL